MIKAKPKARHMKVRRAETGCSLFGNKPCPYSGERCLICAQEDEAKQNEEEKNNPEYDLTTAF